MYELKKLERYLGVNLLGPGPRLIKKTYRAAVLQRLRNTDLEPKLRNPGALPPQHDYSWHGY